ncbi:MAG: hypothetical protein JJD97_03385 [Gemmatimonadaceae bacterium]|nr:hypothetical protein [Gemmatimonadaceae bacterium]
MRPVNGALARAGASAFLAAPQTPAAVLSPANHYTVTGSTVYHAMSPTIRSRASAAESHAVHVTIER